MLDNILSSGYTRNTSPCLTCGDQVGYSQDSKSLRIGSGKYPVYYHQFRLGNAFCVETHKKIIWFAPKINEFFLET